MVIANQNLDKPTNLQPSATQNNIRTKLHVYTCSLKNSTELKVYSPSHIAQIMDFLDFLHEYCEEKPETFTEF